MTEPNNVCKECDIDVYCGKCFEKARTPNVGDYVLATKYSDGDTHDPWAVGYYAGEVNGRHMVTDGEGRQFRLNGFRRVSKLQADTGNWLVQNSKILEVFPGSGMIRLWDMFSQNSFVLRPSEDRPFPVVSGGNEVVE